MNKVILIEIRNDIKERSEYNVNTYKERKRKHYT
jgi:hypothetical protein